MRFRSLRTFLVACVATLALPLAAHAAGDVQVSLTAHRIFTDATGRETRTAADRARPGEVIEYQARYANTGHSGVRAVVATLPIPAGTAYLPATAAPGAALASLDGEHFEPMPLRRRVRLADGTEVLRAVPLDQYRYLRWTLGDLPVGQSRMVRARVRVGEGAGPLADAARTH